MEVYVVIQWSDHRRGGNEVKIIGTYSNEEKARNIMDHTATQFAAKMEQDIEKFDNGYNITDGEDYVVFEILKSKLE